MFKQRIALVVGAILAIIGLYSLPRVVVSNEENNLEQAEMAAVTQSEGEEEFHQMQVNAESRKDISRLTESYNNAENTEKSLIFADSLAQTYKNAGLLDSAAYYYSLISNELNSEGSFLKAADAYYDAFGFAMNDQKRSSLAERCREYYSKYLQLRPDDLDAKSRMAMTYVQSENPMQGIALLREVLVEDESNRTAIFNLGLLSITSGQYDKAEERFAKLIELDDSDAEAHFYLGYTLYEKGEGEKAKKEFEQVISLEKDSDNELVVSANNYLELLKK